VIFVNQSTITQIESCFWEVLVKPTIKSILCNSLTNVTLRDMLCNFSFHASPSEVLSQVLVHLGTAGVHGELGQMCLVQYLLAKLMVLGYNNTLIEP
jgi:hypothetical protein